MNSSPEETLQWEKDGSEKTHAAVKIVQLGRQVSRAKFAKSHDTTTHAGKHFKLFKPCFFSLKHVPRGNLEESLKIVVFSHKM